MALHAAAVTERSSSQQGTVDRKRILATQTCQLCFHFDLDAAYIADLADLGASIQAA